MFLALFVSEAYLLITFSSAVLKLQDNGNWTFFSLHNGEKPEGVQGMVSLCNRCLFLHVVVSLQIKIVTGNSINGT